LILNGIKAERLTSKGLGEHEPAEIPNSEGEMVFMTPKYIKRLRTKAEKEEAHQRNRRTAFKVLKDKMSKE
jgi:outer membrane protein OmpA-like peptidoglycan-associated protein